jgi:hypothetical protein
MTWWRCVNGVVKSSQRSSDQTQGQQHGSRALQRVAERTKYEHGLCIVGRRSLTKTARWRIQWIRLTNLATGTLATEYCKQLLPGYLFYILRYKGMVMWNVPGIYPSVYTPSNAVANRARTSIATAVAQFWQLQYRYTSTPCCCTSATVDKQFNLAQSAVLCYACLHALLVPQLTMHSADVCHCWTLFNGVWCVCMHCKIVCKHVK